MWKWKQMWQWKQSKYIKLHTCKYLFNVFGKILAGVVLVIQSTLQERYSPGWYFELVSHRLIGLNP